MPDKVTLLLGWNPCESKAKSKRPEEPYPTDLPWPQNEVNMDFDSALLYTMQPTDIFY
jgi:hypothetical protein